MPPDALSLSVLVVGVVLAVLVVFVGFVTVMGGLNGRGEE
jgi:Na+-transporting methylmalonyl-CoA/oxaloacetate decarboxylase gamma subunit